MKRPFTYLLLLFVLAGCEQQEPFINYGFVPEPAFIEWEVLVAPNPAPINLEKGVKFSLEITNRSANRIVILNDRGKIANPEIVTIQGKSVAIGDSGIDGELGASLLLMPGVTKEIEFTWTNAVEPGIYFLRVNIGYCFQKSGLPGGALCGWEGDAFTLAKKIILLE